MYPYVMDKTEQQAHGRQLAQEVSAHISARRAAIARLIDAEITDRRAHTQTALLESGRKLIADKGAAGASVGDITKHAGFTRGAFYSNFTDMDHFLAEVARIEWNNTLQEVVKILDTWEFRQENPFDGAVAVMMQVIPRDRERYLLWNEFSTVEIRFPDSSNELAKHSSEFYNSLVDLLGVIIKSFDLEPTGSLEDLVDAIIGLSARSTRNELLANTHPLYRSTQERTLLERLLPDLVRALTRPRA